VRPCQAPTMAAFEELPAAQGSGTVLVTGAAGFIGSHVAEALLHRGETVAVVDEVNDYYDPRIKRANLNRLTKGWGQRVKIYEGDICDEQFINHVFEAEGPIRRIIHLAARAGVRPSIQDPFIYVHSNLEATTRLLELARIYGCDHFVYASSSSVYGESSSEAFSEQDVVEHPVSPYAATKKMCELTAHTYHHLYGFPVAGLRFFTVYGPGGRPDMAPFKFVDRVLRGAEIQQFGDGSSSRDYTYIDDIVDGVIRTLDRPSGYQIYNLGNGDPIELREFIGIVERCCDRPAIINQLPTQPGDVPRTCADISKARGLLGYNPQTSFEEGIRRTVQWYQEHYAQDMARGAPMHEIGPEDEVPIPKAEVSGAQEIPTEEHVRVLPDLPAGLPEEVSQLILSLHLASLSSRSASSPASSFATTNPNLTWSPGGQGASVGEARPKLCPELFTEGQ